MSAPSKWYPTLKPHMVVVHRIDHDYYEVRARYTIEEGVYTMYPIVLSTGAIDIHNYDLVLGRDVEPIAPTHPVYIRWATRRLQDRLEGLDR